MTSTLNSSNNHFHYTNRSKNIQPWWMMNRIMKLGISHRNEKCVPNLSDVPNFIPNARGRWTFTSFVYFSGSQIPYLYRILWISWKPYDLQYDRGGSIICEVDWTDDIVTEPFFVIWIPNFNVLKWDSHQYHQ